MKVSTATLRQAALVLLKHLEDQNQNEIEIDEDFYWDIPSDLRYDPYKEPTKMTIGQLSDDWNELSRIADGEVAPVGYALVWLAAVTRRVGEKVLG